MSSPGKAGSSSNSVNSLNKQECLHAIVRIAIMRYVLTREQPDVSQALERLLTNDIFSNVDMTVLQDSNAFRRRFCYIEETDAVLRKHEQMLVDLYTVYAGRRGGASGRATKLEQTLLGYDEWTFLLRDFAFIGEDFTTRDATLCFVWSRMMVANPETVKGDIKARNLCFEDFLEAIVRTATLKALPTDEEIRAAQVRNCRNCRIPAWRSMRSLTSCLLQ